MQSAFGASNDEKSLFIFRRDLRLEDNTGLISALSQAADMSSLALYSMSSYSNLLLLNRKIVMLYNS